MDNKTSNVISRSYNFQNTHLDCLFQALLEEHVNRLSNQALKLDTLHLFYLVDFLLKQIPCLNLNPVKVSLLYVTGT